MTRLHTYLCFVLLFLLAACDDMKDVPTPVDLQDTPGETGKMYVLSEGLFNMNNCTLGLLNFDNHTLNADFFLFRNNRGLGDTGNDMKAYGSKLWIVVNVSSQVEVLDLKTGLSIRRIPFFNTGGVARQPRYITFVGSKAYVCSFDGTVARIDTSSLMIDGITTAGRNPDGITTANGKLYISNSGGLDAPNYDSTVSVVDINTFTELKKITAGLNLYKIETDSRGDVYVISRGNYGTNPSKLVKIDSHTDEVVQTFDNLQAMNFCILNDTAYLYSYDFTSNVYSIKTFDCKTETVVSDKFISDGTTLTQPFGIGVNSTNSHVYITDARNYTSKGDLLCFTHQGKLLYKVENIGLNPSLVLSVP